MAKAPDYRGDRMDSAEGHGLARGRWYAYRSTIPTDVWDAAGPRLGVSPLPETFSEFLAKAVRESADLMGFWLAWHLAGGFENLEAAGWHRATIFRKVRRFRSVFGEHPDVHQFPWIKLDLNAYWQEGLFEGLGISGETGAS